MMSERCTTKPGMAILSLALALAGGAFAQDYPTRPVRLVVASSPGSGVDIVARLVAQRMSEAMGTQLFEVATWAKVIERAGLQ